MNLPKANIIDQIADERDGLRDENQKLRNYIKQLESVGNYWIARGIGRRTWNKLMESKP